MANTVTIEIDGQKFPLPEDIAADDTLLKAALGPFVPWMANAQIDRANKDGSMVVSVIKRADWKGNAAAVLSALIAAPEEKNPAIALWSQLQDTCDLNDPGVLLALEPAINDSIAAGEKDIEQVREALERLVGCAAASASRIALGF